MNKFKEGKNILYHYTSVAAILKILEGNENGKFCLRATHAKFFNDPYEYKLAISLLKSSLNRYENENSIPNKKSKLFRKRTFSNMGMIFGSPFILSLSENEDDLTMWRTYGLDGKGVALGLDKSKLSEYSNSKQIINTQLLKCHYDKETIIKGLKEYWGAIYDKISIINEGKTVGMDSFGFVSDINLFSFTFKRSEYKAEKEWRLCSNVGDRDVNYLERDGLIIPYIEHNFANEIIKKIVIGPCVNKQLTKESIEILLRTKKIIIPRKDIITSKVPYRRI